MHTVDHKELDPPMMLCPMLPPDRDGRPRQCTGEQCAMWYRASDPNYSGCSTFITAFYSRSISYHAAQDGRSYKSNGGR